LQAGLLNGRGALKAKTQNQVVLLDKMREIYYNCTSPLRRGVQWKDVFYRLPMSHKKVVTKPKEETPG
jgi:hypothetical protein